MNGNKKSTNSLPEPTGGSKGNDVVNQPTTDSQLSFSANQRWTFASSLCFFSSPSSQRLNLAEEEEEKNPSVCRATTAFNANHKIRFRLHNWGFISSLKMREASLRRAAACSSLKAPEEEHLERIHKVLGSASREQLWLIRFLSPQLPKKKKTTTTRPPPQGKQPKSQGGGREGGAGGGAENVPRWPWPPLASTLTAQTAPQHNQASY